MKFLCVCERGNSRSVTLARLLKDQYNEDALSIGFTANSAETRYLLCHWADRILITDRRLLEKVPLEFGEKVRLLDIGPDRWGMAWHPEMVEIFSHMLDGMMHI